MTYSTAQKNALSCKIEMITPEIATKIRAECHFDRQRDLTQEHIKRLAVEMSLGWFLPGTPIWICELPEGKRYLINGNHTLEAVRASKVAIPLTVITQRVATFEEAAQAYACFDIQRSRTWMQAARAVGLSNEVPLLNRALPAMLYIMQDFKDGKSVHPSTLKSRHARFDAVKEYRSALVHLQQMQEGAPEANKRLLWRGAILAVAMVTTRYQPSSAEEFWGGIVQDNGLVVGDPRKTLLRYLQSNTVRQANTNMLYAAMLAWNAHFDGRKLEVVKPSQVKVFRLAGTPWAKEVEIKAPERKAPKNAGMMVNP